MISDDYNTTQHIAPHHIIPHHTTSHYITSNHIKSHTTSHHITQHHTTSHHIKSHITSHHITPYHITSPTSHHTTLHNTKPHHPHHTTPYHTISYHTIPYHTTWGHNYTLIPSFPVLRDFHGNQEHLASPRGKKMKLIKVSQPFQKLRCEISYLTFSPSSPIPPAGPISPIGPYKKPICEDRTEPRWQTNLWLSIMDDPPLFQYPPLIQIFRIILCCPVKSFQINFTSR